MMRGGTTAGPLLGLVLLLAACAGGGRRDAHVEAMAREHANDAPTPTPVAQAPVQDVVAREVEYGSVDGRPLTGYLARPLRAEGDLPGIVVIHEWWGLNDNVRAATRRLAAEGYTALAVDMYRGRTAATPEEARELATAARQRPEAGVENLRAAAGYLREEAGAERVGIMGWCFGGGWSLRGAVGAPELFDAAVMYYGQPITDPTQLARLDAPLLGLFAAEDQGIPLAEVRAMEAALQELGKEATVVVYPGVGHAFANPSGGNYDEEAAEDAWRRTTEFFAEHLKEGVR